MERKTNRKLKLSSTEMTFGRFHNHPYKTKEGKTKWYVQSINTIYWYNNDTNTWVTEKPFHTTTKCFNSIKAIIRHLRKQPLLPNSVFYIYGRYVGEEYLLTAI